MPRIKENKDKISVLSREDFKRIINRFNIGSSFYIPVQIAYNTGLRSGEVCALRWRNRNLENGTLEVNHNLIYKDSGVFELGDPKTQSSKRKIKIGSTLIDILKSTSYNKGRVNLS